MFSFFLEMFGMGVRNLHLHKLRSLLTALGIIIGVAAVIIMVAIGEGSKQAAMEQLRRLGPNNIVIRSVKPPESSDASARQQSMLTYGLKRLDLRRVETGVAEPSRELVHVRKRAPEGLDHQNWIVRSAWARSRRWPLPR